MAQGGLARVALLTVLLLTLMASTAHSQAATACGSARLVVKEDGSVEVLLNITVQSPPGTGENVTIETIGSPVYAEARTSDGVVLPVELGNNSVTVTLLPGVESFTLYYITLDATSKTGEKWSLSYRLPCPSTVILPDGAVPAGMSPEPGVVIVNGTVAFRFPPGQVSVSYIIPPEIGAGGPGMSTTAPGGASPGGSSAPGPSGGSGGSRLPIVAGALLAVAAAGAAVYLFLVRRGRSGGVEVPVEAPLLDDRDRKIVEALRGRPEGMTASELIEATGIPKTPLYRRLNRLARDGVIEYYDEGGVRRYRLKRG